MPDGREPSAAAALLHTEAGTAIQIHRPVTWRGTPPSADAELVALRVVHDHVVVGISRVVVPEALLDARS